ncbi:MAG: hypothetical protein BAJALOKI2v1_440027 [Promethearchaeota archaeon]|nr:MAG: hypothetical protein BAJALOKI2v1_440027 [Candidatus Lokiarchaeota archaeon]
MDQKVNEYIKRLGSPQKEICEELRSLILKNFPNIKESMKYGVPYYDNKFYIVGLKDSVNLGFSIKNLSSEEISFFEGTGKTTRHLKFHSINDINKEKVIELLNLVDNKS